MNDAMNRYILVCNVYFNIIDKVSNPLLGKISIAVVTKIFEKTPT
jgi:hypothetical protein